MTGEEYRTAVEGVLGRMLDGMEQHPKMYGSNPDELEGQYLVLLYVMGVGYGIDENTITSTFRTMSPGNPGMTVEGIVARLRSIRMAIEAIKSRRPDPLSGTGPSTSHH
jgi:hypothetical protein